MPPGAFGNLFVPLHIGANDVAFPRLNLLSWWLYVVGAIIILATVFTPGGPPDTGWTFYVPFSTQTTHEVSMTVLGILLVGFSSILTGLNMIMTVHRLRAPGMKWSRLPLFVWSIYATAWIQLLATPVLAITLVLVAAQRLFHVGLFNASAGGDPIMYQHLFWIYSHPAVYIMVLPAMGIVSEIIAVFSRKRVFGYWAMAVSVLAIAGGRLPGLGPPHVRQRHERPGGVRLLAADLRRRHPLGHQGLQLADDHVQGLHLPRSRRCSTPCPSSFSSPSAD